MSKTTFVVLVIIIILFIIILGFIVIAKFGNEDTWLCQDGQWVKHGQPSDPMPSTPCSLKYANENTNLNEPLGNQNMNQNINVPTNTNSLANLNTAPENKPNIIVTSPKSGDSIGLPLKISGTARVFESQFNYRLKDQNGNILAQGNGTANAPDAGQYGNFEITENYTLPSRDTGTLEVFDYSAKDGSMIDLVSIPIKFSNVAALTLKVFFGNTTKNPNAQDCNLVFPIERRIAKTTSTAHSAIAELLTGPTDAEKNQGYFTSINSGVTLQKLSIIDGVAKIDFNETLEQGVGGSCKVAAIRAQITQTLKQFSSVKDVIISINGRTEDILQP
jgi:spore germination protein GerM